MEKTTLYLPDELQGQIKHLARQKKTSQAHVIREALATYVAEQERPLPRSIGCMDNQPDDGVTAENVKDWIHAQWDREYDELQDRLREIPNPD